VIEPVHLRLDPGPRGGPSLADVLDVSGPLAEVRERAAARAEEEAIALAMSEAGGDRAAAATKLGVSLSTLGRRLRESNES
jgi:DNA-binding NtrC family response regulator